MKTKVDYISFIAGPNHYDNYNMMEVITRGYFSRRADYLSISVIGKKTFKIDEKDVKISINYNIRPYSICDFSEEPIFIVFVYDRANKSEFESAEFYLKHIYGWIPQYVQMTLVGIKYAPQNESVIKNYEGKNLADRYCIPYKYVHAWKIDEFNDVFIDLIQRTQLVPKDLIERDRKRLKRTL